MKRLRENAMLEAEISVNGDVFVEGHHVGQLAGFRFTLAAGEGADATAVQGAAHKALALEFGARAARLQAAGTNDLAMSSDGLVRWLGVPVARLAASDHVMRPRVILLDRIAGNIFSGCVSGALALTTLITWVAADSRWVPLLLTFLYRHLQQLIANGKVYLAPPPLYRIDIGKETYWALGDAHRDRILKQHGNGRAHPEITRFKGLGEMMPKVLWETTLNTKTRRLLRVEIADQIVTDRVINELMGKDASARFRFIMERAEEAEELDV